jgi:hypothetical protein
MRHPDPDSGVRYAIFMTVFALREVILFDQVEAFGDLIPLSDGRLEEELPRIFLRQLGIESNGSAAD